MNRITVKPLIKFDDNLVYGYEMLIFAFNKFFFSLLEGRSPFSADLLQITTKNALAKKKQVSSHEFEIAVGDEIKKFCNYFETNICAKKNDKCFKDISEKCPGQIDVLSIHLDQKKIIIWDAKNIDDKVGARDICNKIDEFTEGKGYIEITKTKEIFVNNHIKEIMNYYKIKDDPSGWKVKSCFVLSSDHFIKFFLEDKYDFINFFEIEEYSKLSKNN
jgi:hypothetical protein